MEFLAKLMRGASKARFKALRLATIKDIPTDQFNALIDRFRSEGWRKKYEYKGFDAWIDYGCVKLRRDSIVIKFEWDNWTEGSVEGPQEVIGDLAREIGFEITPEWRWSEYDV